MSKTGANLVGKQINGDVLNQIPDFLIKGVIKQTVCRVQDPLIGHITVEKSVLAIKSIELQLIRVEIVTG